MFAYWSTFTIFVTQISCSRLKANNNNNIKLLEMLNPFIMLQNFYINIMLLITEEYNKMIQKPHPNKIPMMKIVMVAIVIAPILLFSNYTESKAVTTNNPNNSISGSGQGQVQCPASVSSSPSSSSSFGSNTYRGKMSFDAYKVGQTITGSFDIRSNVDTRSVGSGSIDTGQMIGNQYILTGTIRKNFGLSICGSSISTSSSSNTVSPTRIIITGQCGTGSRTIQLKADNGEIGTFTGDVDCTFIGNNNNNNNNNNPPLAQQHQSNNNNNNYQ